MAAAAAAAAAGVACSSASYIPKPGGTAKDEGKGRAAPGERTLRISQWGHFVSAYDTWFDNESLGRGARDPSGRRPHLRYRLFEAMAELMGAVGTAAPVRLVLDDLHWADQPTLSLLRHLVRPGRTARLLLVGTYRDTELDRGHPLAQLLADLRREPGVERLVLRGLSREQVARLVEMAGVDLAPLAGALADAVYHETEGNAFFVGEVMRHFAESRAVLGRGGRPAAEGILTELGVPEGVREVVGRRLSRAMGAAGDVLAVAAVIGRDFDVGLLLEASGAGSDAVLDTLERAEEARLVAPLSGPAERYTFSHALVRSTIYDDLPASKRARLHRRVGEALARRTRDEHFAELAHHFHAAGPAGDPARTLEYSVRAGGQANASLAHEQAAVCYTLALEALGWAGPDGEPRRAEVLLARGEAWRRVGEPERAREDFLAAAEAARRRNDPEALARAALGVGEVSAVWGADADLVELLEAALEGLAKPARRFAPASSPASGRPSSTRTRSSASSWLPVPWTKRVGREIRRLSPPCSAPGTSSSLVRTA